MKSMVNMANWCRFYNQPLLFWYLMKWRKFCTFPYLVKIALLSEKKISRVGIFQIFPNNLIMVRDNKKPRLALKTDINLPYSPLISLFCLQ